MSWRDWIRGHIGPAENVPHTESGDVTQPPHLHLDPSSDETEIDPSSDDDTVPLRRWLGFALALALGAAAGVVGTNAHHEAVERSHVELIGGHATVELNQSLDALEPSSESPNADASGPGGGADTDADTEWRAELLVFNGGQRSIELADLEINGWRPSGDAAISEPVELRPDTWTTVQAHVAPACDADPPDDSATTLPATAVVGDPPVDDSPQIEFRPVPRGLHTAWHAVCSPDELETPQVWATQLHSAEILSRDAERGSMRVRLAVTPSFDPPVPASRPDLERGSARPERDIAVVRIWSHIAGLDATVPDLPVEIPAGETGELEIEWRIIDCDALDDLERATLSLHLSENVETPLAQVRDAPVPSPVIYELGKLSSEACQL
ncbi:hypothetical protein EF847_02435 [Actinobacteria bacterium YIM 96077]|uniref:Uncharacterized protein n=1 Tax=Phytoactinopolyspora halophila TaxID=1981511 RepID=A0A329QZI5_9ACTN|nr:hypothetical protein [Phytoactinopolyspora halophila]AYY11754.1 hypothetical protein EF847_02435 [Actinobacteria bacterium YIM 96077]RAW17810.1 hypothetical protein DPM12_02840 [Phytoactinopolyspora halophila]